MILTAVSAWSGTVIGGRMARSFSPLVAGLALGALAVTFIEPAPLREAREGNLATIDPVPRHDKRAVHPADVEPAAGIVVVPPTVIRYTGVPQTVSTQNPPSSSLPAWRINAVASPPIDGRPMIAVIIDDMGLERRRSRQAVTLPAPLTLAYLPYARDLKKQTRAARERGHELLVHVPMEGVAPSGINTLRRGHTEEELLRRLDWSLGRFEGFVGPTTTWAANSRLTPRGFGSGLIGLGFRIHGGLGFRLV